MLAVAGNQTLAALLVVAIARYDSSSRLAPHPATAAKLPNLSLRGALSTVVLANAGTHTYTANGEGFFKARTMMLSSLLRADMQRYAIGLWVPAFARTTGKE
ncbi:MAG: hypothetical protein V7642_5708 [Burkholderiales bacterium]